MTITQGEWWYDEQSEGVGSDSGWVCSLSMRSQKGDQEFGDVVDDGNLLAAAPKLLAALRPHVRGVIAGLYHLDQIVQSGRFTVLACRHCNGYTEDDDMWKFKHDEDCLIIRGQDAIAMTEGKEHATARATQQGSGE